MKALIISSLAAIFLFSSAGTGLSQPRQKFNKRVNMERHIEKLNLTEEQENKISDLRTSHQKKMADYKADLEKAKIDMRDIRSSSDISRANMISAVEKMNDVKNKMAIERVNHQMDVYELLTDEQREIWREQKPFRDHQGLGFKNKSNGKRFNCF